MEKENMCVRFVKTKKSYQKMKIYHVVIVVAGEWKE